MKRSFHIDASVRLAGAVMIVAAILMAVTAQADQTSPVLGIRDNTPTARAFVNATIVTAPGQRLDSATLIIERGRIIAVGANLKVPESISAVDLNGAWIFPGFIEAYTEYGLDLPKQQPNRRLGPPQYETERIGGSSWNEAVHADRAWFEQFKPNKRKSDELMKQGFTVVQSLGQDGIFRGESFVALLGEGLPNDLILHAAWRQGVSFNKGSSSQQYPESLMGTIALIRQMFYDADWYSKALEAFRQNPEQERPEFNAALSALALYGISPFLFDGGEDLYSLNRFDRIAREFGLHYVAVGSGKEYQRLADIAALHRTLILPIDFPETPSVETMEDRLDVTLAQLRHWETAPTNPARLIEAGVHFALTTDRLKSPDMFWKSLRRAMKSGLSADDALAALTTVPAEICGIEDRCGTIEPGKLANFFICHGDLFEQEEEIYSVWVAGQESVLEPIPTADFTGKYELAVNDTEFSLSISGDRLKGKLEREEWVTDLVGVQSDRNKIEFSAKLDSVESAGLAQFSGRLTEDTISGQCVLDNGSTVDFRAVRTGTVEEPPDSTKTVEQDKTPSPLLSRLTYPNEAFGLESIPPQQETLIKNATVWTADTAGIIENCDVLIKNGLIAAVGRDLKAAGDAAVVDATGLHLSPGIIDAHSHLAIAGDVNEGTHSLTPEVRIGDVIDPDQINIYRQLAGGVTACLTLHGSANSIGGQCQVIKLRWGSNAEEMKFVEATPTIKFAMGENVKQSNWGDLMRERYPQTRMGVTNIMADEFSAAREYEADWQKFNILSRKEQARTIPPRKDIGLDAIVELLHDQRNVHCHTYVQSEILALIRLAEQYGFTIDVFVHTLEGYKVADEIAHHGAGVTTFTDWWAYKFEVYDAIPYNAALLHDRSVLTSFKSDDADLARRLNQEAGKAVMYGNVPQEEAIKFVTINPAIQLGIDKFTGSIRVGKQADLVVFNGSPLSVYSRVEKTYVDGRKYFDRTDDERQRQEIKDERNQLIQKVLSSSEGKGSKPGGPPGRGPRIPDRLNDASNEGRN